MHRPRPLPREPQPGRAAHGHWPSFLAAIAPPTRRLEYTLPEAPHGTPNLWGRGPMMDKIVNIGQSIQIKGELTGNEDLTIEGKVDGKISLKDHNLTIGPNGRITADI